MPDNEAINLDVLDTRLTDDGIEWYCEWTKGGDPKRRILVSADTPLDAFLSTVKTRASIAKIGVLSILAHGWGEWEYADVQRTRKKRIHGGFGLEFCKEGLNMKTVERFKDLNGLFSSRDGGIRLMGCAAAAQYQFGVAPNSKETKKGFGKDMCSKLAELTATSVMASDSFQQVAIDRDERTYRWGNDIRTIKSCVTFGDWEGSVWIFRPDRKIEKAPSGKNQ